MHPAFSVIFLTTLIGAGQGLFLVLYALDAMRAFRHRRARAGTALLRGRRAGRRRAAGLGLVASFFHLGHPERAWRSAAKWRTSWLSREVIVLPAFIGGVDRLMAPRMRSDGRLRRGSASLTLVACIALFVCTGMVYACIRFLQEWASPLTLVNFFLLGAASGVHARGRARGVARAGAGHAVRGGGHRR